MVESANLDAQNESEVKEQRLAFEVKPMEEHQDICSITDEQLNAKLEKGYANMQAGRTIPAAEVFADIRRDYGV